VQEGGEWVELRIGTSLDLFFSLLMYVFTKKT